MNTEQALDIVGTLADEHSQTHGTICLEDKFWVWETLEEALRGNVDSLSYDQTLRVWCAFGTHLKGSEDLFDMLEQRVHYEKAELK